MPTIGSAAGLVVLFLPAPAAHPMIGEAALPRAIAPPAAVAPAATPDAQEAKELVERVVKRYRSAKSYRDTGTGSLTISAGTPDTSFVFDTAFDRNVGFRWSYTSDIAAVGNFRRKTVVWSDDGKTWNYWQDLTGQTRQFRSLSQALAGPTGGSHGLARIVPELLQPDRKPSTLFVGMTGKRVRGKESVAGIECDVLEGDVLGAEGTTTLWIDSTGAIRKYRQQLTIDPSTLPPPPSLPPEEAARMRALPKFDRVTEFLFEPQFDVDVPATETAFTPPAKVIP